MITPKSILLLAGVVTALGLQGSSVAAQGVADPAPCITLARDIHQYAMLLRDDQYRILPTEVLDRVGAFWRRFEASDAYQHRNDPNAWDRWWNSCYNHALYELGRR